IDWHSRFVAGAEGAILDRTPMPGEPRGAVNGGYAGLGTRLASPPLAMTVVTTDGPITEYVSDRARPNAPAVGATFTDNGRVVGAIAILSDAANIGERAPWYIINNNTMRFIDPAILAPAVRTLKPGETWTLAYRIAVRRSAWTPERLRAALAAWTR
ncbi:MAG: PmoA family protein, partial [Acidobacteria bacterium]|nr:PmoA family protein [Acidobacteriota bacterium]